MRALASRWAAGTGWPLRLDWVEMKGLRGWDSQRFELRFPIMAVVGENGAGKSTILQAAASIYAVPPGGGKNRFASEFFPSTAWDQVEGVDLRYAARQGTESLTGSVRKPTSRWLGNPDRPKREVVYIDLSRIQPVPERVGYSRLANAALNETSAKPFDDAQVTRLSHILGRKYDGAKMALTDADTQREVPVISRADAAGYSGFHQGAGETTIAELLQKDLPKNSLVLIDEVETSLHPRAQRRLVRDLAHRARIDQLQIILTTHSPYVLEELPSQARCCIVETGLVREFVYGISAEFAMSKMDDEPVYELEVYVEDERAKALVIEMLTAQAPHVVPRIDVVPYGAASVGAALGQMVINKKFKRPTVVVLDGDQDKTPGCVILPGGEAPEIVVFKALQAHQPQWRDVHRRLGRAYPDVADACNRAMLSGDHHGWLQAAAAPLVVGTDLLWQAMCAEWATVLMRPGDATPLVEAVQAALP
jgi:predicted ATPase